MKALRIFILGAVVAAGPVAAQKIFVDYDSATAFSQFRTYQLKETREDLRDTYPDIHRDVVVKIKKYLQEGGMAEAASDPDVFVAYYTADAQSLRLVLGDLEYSYGPNFSLGGYWEGGVGTRTPSSFEFREGTLVVDVWDARERLLVFRGIATATLSKDYEKNVKKVNRALDKIIKTWAEMKGDRVRALRKLKEEEEGANR